MPTDERTVQPGRQDVEQGDIPDPPANEHAPETVDVRLSHRMKAVGGEPAAEVRHGEGEIDGDRGAEPGGQRHRRRPAPAEGELLERQRRDEQQGIELQGAAHTEAHARPAHASSCPTPHPDDGGGNRQQVPVVEGVQHEGWRCRPHQRAPTRQAGEEIRDHDREGPKQRGRDHQILGWIGRQASSRPREQSGQNGVLDEPLEPPVDIWEGHRGNVAVPVEQLDVRVAQKRDVARAAHRTRLQHVPATSATTQTSITVTTTYGGSVFRMALRTDSTRWRVLPAAMHNPLSTLPEFLGIGVPRRRAPTEAAVVRGRRFRGALPPMGGR